MKVNKEQVCHRQFGIGTVIDQTETMIEVKFKADNGNKKFLYPSAFESFLSLSSPEMQSKMDEELKKIQNLKEAENQKYEVESKKRQDDERKNILDQKKALAKKRTAEKSIAKKLKEEADAMEEEEEKEDY